MGRWSDERGYLLVDVIMGLVLFGYVMVTIYQVFIPILALSRDANDRLLTQQDIRLALDRLARPLHETTLAAQRVRVYSEKEGCSGANEGCIGFVTPRSESCAGPFQLRSGAPNWQATIYVWRDVVSGELRSRCDPTTTFPVPTWPPTLTPFTVIGTHVSKVSFTLQPAGSAVPVSLAVDLQEQSTTRPQSRHLPTEVLSVRTVIVPENP